MEPSFVVLGSSGWVGHYVVPALKKLNPTSHITAVFRSRTPTFPASVANVVASIDDVQTIKKLSSATVINLNRGETEADFEVHRRIIEVQNQRSARYLYASSFNAVDSELSKPHGENDSASSQSPYGQFKARCERELLKSCRRPLTFRFAGTHGWAPNRPARTQEFLEKLSRGEKVTVMRGIVQNRTFVGDLSEQIAMLALEESAEGVFNLGTSDFSDEIDFLRQIARAFGHDEEQVVEGESTECNAVMLVERLCALFPSYRLPTESDTILKVAHQPELLNFSQAGI